MGALVEQLLREGVILERGVGDIPYEDRHFIPTPCTEAEGQRLAERLGRAVAGVRNPHLHDESECDERCRCCLACKRRTNRDICGATCACAAAMQREAER